MNEKEELRQELEEELEWVKCRQNMLDLMENKLFQMRDIAQRVALENLSLEEARVLNDELKSLSLQIRALDEESRKVQNILYF